MVTADIDRFRFLLFVLTIQGLTALPVGENTIPVDFPHGSKFKGILSDACFGSKKRVIPHPEDCAMYYNCTSIYRVIPLYMEQNMHECPYPKLFSTETDQCEMYYNVKCGKRKEPKWECQYRQHWCKDEECLQPCASKYPSCIGKPDGVNPYRDGQNLLPYYLECEDERVVKIKICPRVPVITRFSPLTNRCEALSRIPIEYNKINTMCRMKGDGYHADAFGRCKNYFRCTNGRFESFGTCLGTELFDPKRRACAKPETICGRCGTAGPNCKYNKKTNETQSDSQELSSTTESVTSVNNDTTGSLLAVVLSSHVTTGVPSSTTSGIFNDEDETSNRTEAYEPYVTVTMEHMQPEHTTQSSDTDDTQSTEHTQSSDTDVTQTKEQIQSSDTDVTQTTEQIQSSDADVTETKEQIQSSDTDVTQTTEQIQSSDADVTQTKEQIQSSDTDVTQTTEQIQSSDADITQTKEQIQSSDTDVTQTTEQIQSSDADITQTKEQIQSSDTDVTQTTEQIQSSDADVTQTTEHTQSSDADITQTTEHTQSSDTDVTQTTEHTQSSDADVTQTTEQIQSSDKDVTHTTEHTQSSDTDVTQTTEQIQSSDKDVTHTTEHTQSSDVDVTHTTEHMHSSDTNTHYNGMTITTTTAIY